MQGLFNQSLTFPKTDKSFQLNTIPLETDLLLKVDENCPRFIEIQDYAAAEKAITEMRLKISNDMEKDFFPRLRKMTNMTDASTDQMLDVCTYLYWAFQSNLTIKFADQLTSEDRKMISVTVNEEVFQAFQASDELIAFPAFELFNTLNEFVSYLKTKTWSGLKYFTKYFKVEAHSKFPKFIFYSGHAEVLAPLFLALDENIVTNRDPGSAIFFEFYTESLMRFKPQILLRIFYKPTASLDDSDTQVLMIQGMTHRKDGSILVQDFAEFLQAKIEKWNNDLEFKDLTTNLSYICSKL